MSLDSLLISSIMSKDVKTENENQNVMAACKVMRENNIGCVIIVRNENNDKSPIGVITERDIVNILGEQTIDFAKPLSRFMSKPLISIQSNCSIREAIRLMTSKNVRRLVVVDVNNKMTGIITEKDIFSQISKSPNMLTDFVGQNHPGEHKEVYSRFTEYMFDLLPKI
jgi:predicted transcriptional regulator